MANNAPIPRTLESPPRTTGKAEQDLPILIDWFWKAYQVIQQSVAFINDQVTVPDFNAADLPDPENTTLATAQQTANDAYNLASQADRRLDGFFGGTFTLGAAAAGGSVSFTVAQPDNDYRVILQPVSDTGSPPIDAYVVKSKTYTAGGFSFTMGSVPGVGNSVTWEFQLIRNT